MSCEWKSKDMEMERTLWHGTTVEALENICQYGFNRSYCGRNGEELNLIQLYLSIAWPLAGVELGLAPKPTAVGANS